VPAVKACVLWLSWSTKQVIARIQGDDGNITSKGNETVGLSRCADNKRRDDGWRSGG
jgi:hypothetical protein